MELPGEGNKINKKNPLNGLYFQLDYFNVAATAYVLLSGSYLKLKKDGEGRHVPQAPYKR